MILPLLSCTFSLFLTDRVLPYSESGVLANVTSIKENRCKLFMLKSTPKINEKEYKVNTGKVL